jgi:hypothetical protein
MDVIFKAFQMGPDVFHLLPQLAVLVQIQNRVLVFQSTRAQ